MKPVSPAERLIDRAKREAWEAGVAFDNRDHDNAEHQVVYDPDERMLVITLFGSD